MSRETDILRAAIPFFDIKMAQNLEAVVKVDELRECVRGERKSTELRVCGQGDSGLDMGGLLQAIRGFCNEKEGRMIDMIQNFIMIRQMMEMMQMMNSMNEMNPDSDSNGGGFSDILGGMMGGGMDMTDMLKGNLSEEQQGQFDMLQSVFSMMNTSQ